MPLNTYTFTTHATDIYKARQSEVEALLERYNVEFRVPEFGERIITVFGDVVNYVTGSGDPLALHRPRFVIVGEKKTATPWAVSITDVYGTRFPTAPVGWHFVTHNDGTPVFRPPMKGECYLTEKGYPNYGAEKNPFPYLILT